MEPFLGGGDESSTSGEKPIPSRGDASKFLTAPFFYQCALVRGGKPCEKIFSSIADAQTHNKSDHGLNDYYYGKTLHIDTDKKLYIL